MGTNPLLELQKKFDLFQVGDKLQGNIVSKLDNMWQLRLFGGALGFINAETTKEYDDCGINLKIGASIKIEVCEIIDGIPYVKLPKEYVRENSVWKAVVKFSGTRALVVEFQNKQNPSIGLYEKTEKNTETWQIWEAGTPLLCKGLTLSEYKDYYLIDEVKLNVEREEKRPQALDTFTPWGKKECEEAVAAGSVQTSGDYTLGEIYVAKSQNGNMVLFPDKTKAMVILWNKNNVMTGDYLFVRIIKLYEFGSYKDVEVLGMATEADFKYFENHCLKQQKGKNAGKKKEDIFDCGFNFSLRDNQIYSVGKANGSLDHFEKYWLGFLYKIEVIGGKLWFTYKNGIPMNIKIIENDDVVFVDGQVVFARVCYIENFDGKVTLTVQPEFCREKNDSDKF